MSLLTSLTRVSVLVPGSDHTTRGSDIKGILQSSSLKHVVVVPITQSVSIFGYPTLKANLSIYTITLHF